MPESIKDQKLLKLCIFSPLKNAYSETFIKNHITYLPFSKYVLNGAEWRDLSFNDELLAPPTALNRVRRKIMAKMTGDENYFEKKRLTSFLKDHKIDVVLAEYGHIGTLIYRACKQLKIPLVVHFHGNDASHRPTLELLKAEYLEMMAYASSIISVSHAMTARLQELGADPKKIIYNCYGIDTRLFKESEKKLKPSTFVAVGRFVEKKAPQLTIAAFAMAKKRHPFIKLIMIGDGPLLEVCKQLVKAARLSDSVEFAGIRPPVEVAGIVAGALAFVQHSVIAADGGAEGTPLAILEAGACGVPVISTRHEGIKDVVIEKETGILVDEFDIDGMAEGMVLLAENPSVAEMMGKKARMHISTNYTLDKHIDMLATAIVNGKNKV